MRQCRQKEQKLNEDFSYVQENASSLMLSGLSAILFGDKHNKAKGNITEAKPANTNDQQSLSFGLSDYMSIAKSMMPLAWEIAQPILVSWSINRAKRWLTKFLFKKKR